ncbi:MAG: sigma-70 family RNA polymerase sigma factor, partial [Planctomycetota bacterium]
MSTKGDPFDPKRLEEHRDLIRRVARQVCRDVHEAEDVEAETLAAALTGSPPEGEESRAWLAVVARRIALRRREAAQSRSFREAERATGLDSEIPSTDEIVAVEEERRGVLTAVLDLPLGQREAILARYHLGLSERAAAKRLDLPLDTLRDRLKRARAQLRDRLRDEHGGDASALVLALAPLAWRPKGPWVSAFDHLRGRIGAQPAARGPQGVWGFVAAASVLIVGGSLLPLLTRSTGPDEELSEALAGTRDGIDRVSNDPGLAPPSNRGLADRRLASAAEAQGQSNFRGRVLDPDGLPVADAFVLLAGEARLSLHLNRPESDGRASRRTRTDADGNFAFEADSSRPGRFVAVWDEVHEPFLRYFDGPREVSVTLVPGRTLDGLLRDAEGEPVEGVEVELEWSLDGLHGAAAATTDREGRWSVRGLPAMGASLLDCSATFRTPDGALQQDRAVETTLQRSVRLDPAVEHDLFWPLELEVLREVRVEVLHPRTGQPLPDAFVQLWLDSSASSQALHPSEESLRMTASKSYASGRTDGTGLWTTPRGPGVLRKGGVARERTHVWVTCTAPGFGWAHERLSIDGTASTHRIRLPEMTELSGALLDAAGEPISGARMRLRFGEAPLVSEIPGVDIDPHHARTTKEGEFKFRQVSVGAEARIEIVLAGASGQAHRRETWVLGRLSGDPPPLELRLAAPTALDTHWVRVVDHLGQPVVGADLRPDGAAWSVQSDASGLAAMVLQETDFVGPLARPRRLEVRHPRYPAVWFPIDLLEGGSSRSQPVPLQLAQATSVEGVVRAPDGAPLAGVAVSIESLSESRENLPSVIRGRRAAAAITDSRGRFEVIGSGLPPYRITAHSPFKATGVEP